MPRVRRCLFLLVSILLMTAWPLHGQSDGVRAQSDLAEHPSSPPLKFLSPHDFALPVRHASPIAPLLLPRMVNASGAIFAGTVAAISRSPVSTNDAVATVAITFHVNHGMRGPTSGQDFTIHQWAGLWNSGQQRYRIGEQVVLFLYPPSKLGLTSCVSGSLGHFQFNNLGRVLLSPEHISALRTDPLLGGKPTIGMDDFAWAVQRAGAGEGSANRP
jgi:hypothetical protein